MRKIECKYCGWSWNESDGGDDKYTCHMCNNDNSKHYLKESEEKKKKLFIPRKIEGEGSRWGQWNKEQPIVDGVRVNQYDMDGRKQGLWEDYYDSGKLYSKGNYINGIWEGNWEWYYDNGKISSKASYVNGYVIW
jgi:antitoxin component YwqK of YwqJK toxin-antitoxin module